MFSTSHFRPEHAVRHAPLRVNDDADVPPWSRKMVSVICDVRCITDGTAECMNAPLLDHGIAVSQGVLHLTEERLCRNPAFSCDLPPACELGHK